MPLESADRGHRMTLTEILRDSLKSYKARKRLSYRAMAIRCRVSPGWLYRFLSGEGGVGLEVAARLAHATGGELKLR